MSPELPHTLFSEIKDNRAFQNLFTSYYEGTSSLLPPTPPSDDGGSHLAKGKGKQVSDEAPFSWVSNFLRSLVAEKTKDPPAESPLPQALAKVMNFCFAEMQHEGWTVEAKAAAAQCGFEVSVCEGFIDK
jgi:senataxin